MKRTCDGLCPSFQAAMDVVAKPWNGLILATLEEGPVRFSELAERLASIGDSALSGRLKDLQERGLVERLVDDGPPVRVSYRLTASGKGFAQVLEAMSRWGAQLAPGGKGRRRAR